MRTRLGEIIRADPEDLDTALTAMETISCLVDTIIGQLKDAPMAALTVCEVGEVVETARTNLAEMIMHRSDRVKDVQWVQ